MRTIELKGQSWTSVLDFYAALLAALKAPSWHSESIGAAIDSIIGGGINKIEPPYRIVVRGASALPAEIRHEIELLAVTLRHHREIRRRRKEADVEAPIEHDGPQIGVPEIEIPEGETFDSEAEVIAAVRVP